jgi:hypothetical protein
MKFPSPEVLLLSRIHWDYFFTLTHKPLRKLETKLVVGVEKESLRYSLGRWWEQLPVHKQRIRFVNWTRQVRRVLRLPKGKFLWVLRLEKGRGGRDHFHLLVRVNQRRKVNKMTMYCMASVWSKKYGYGHVDCRRVNSTDVDEYITKAQNIYENERFSAEPYRSVEFSDSALRFLSSIEHKRVRGAGAIGAESLSVS